MKFIFLIVSSFLLIFSDFTHATINTENQNTNFYYFKGKKTIPDQCKPCFLEHHSFNLNFNLTLPIYGAIFFPEEFENNRQNQNKDPNQFLIQDLFFGALLSPEINQEFSLAKDKRISFGTSIIGPNFKYIQALKTNPNSFKEGFQPNIFL